MTDVVIVNGARTAMGGFQGALSSVSAPELGAVTIKEAIHRAGLAPHDVDEVILGCVLPAGLKQGPARQAMRQAGLPDQTGAVTINKLCGSGMKAVMQATDAIKAGSAQIVVAGGMESMSNAPYILSKARAGYRMGHGEVKIICFWMVWKMPKLAGSWVLLLKICPASVTTHVNKWMISQFVRFNVRKLLFRLDILRTKLCLSRSLRVKAMLWSNKTSNPERQT